MYQITLYDDCSNPIADGTVSYYVDSLEEFGCLMPRRI